MAQAWRGARACVLACGWAGMPVGRGAGLALRIKSGSGPH
jgi:hypothetical protein